MELSDEEQKAIENFKKLDFFDYDWQIGEDEDFETREDMLSYAEKMQEIILNLLEKQQKEIEEKTTIIMAGAEKVKQLEKEIEELKEEQSKRSWVHIKENGEVEPLFYISKDKIREKIKELESLSKNITMQPSIYNYEIDLLEELLEEDK